MNQELIIIDVADMGFGHPVFDLAANYLTFQLTNPEMKAHHIGLGSGLPQIVWDGFIEEYFRSSNKGILAARLKDIVPFAMLKMALSPVIAPNRIPKNSLSVIEKCMRTRFFPYTDDMIRSLALEEWQ